MQRPFRGTRVAMALYVRLRVFACVFLAAASAHAQGSYRAVPTGGRSALMGNTGVALARDGSAPFLNPATIVGIPDPRVAFSVNLYSLTTTTADHFHDPRGGDTGLGHEALSDSRLYPVPSTVCLFTSLAERAESKRELALCAGTVERRDLAASARATGTEPDGRTTLHIGSVGRSSARVHVGPTYALTLSDAVALGASLHVVNTRITSITGGDGTTFDPAGGANASTTSLSSSVSATSFDIAALVGVTLRLDRATTLGAAFAPPSVHLGGEAEFTDAAEAGDLSRMRAGAGRFIAPVPMRAAVGIGMRGKRVHIEADATYFFPVSEAFRSDLDVRTVTTRAGVATDRSDAVTATTDTGGVLDSAVGAEVFVTRSISVLGGLATDFGGVRTLPASPLPGWTVMMREHRGIATLGAGIYGEGGGELLVGTQLGVARGEMLVADTYATPPDLAPVRLTTFTLLFVVAGSTNLSTVRSTFEDIQRRVAGR